MDYKNMVREREQELKIKESTIAALEAAVKEKDVEIAKTIQFGLEHTDQKNKQIAALMERLAKWEASSLCAKRTDADIT